MITPAQRREGRINLAMLPIGVVLVVAAVVGVFAVLALAVTQSIARGAGWGWYVAWAIVAAGVGMRNLVASLKTMSALDVGGTMVTIALSAAIVASYPGWWLP